MRTYLYVANPVELGEIVLGRHNAHHQLPPDGMSRGIDYNGPGKIGIVNLVSLLTDLFVEGMVPPNTADDWYWGTLGEFMTGLSGIDEASAHRIVVAIAGAAGTPLGSALEVPLLKKGTAGSIMRWIRTTFRGELAGGVEFFQHKMDWGHPGADPTLSEADALTLAQTMAEQFVAGWGAGVGTNMGQIASVDVRYTEVGVVQLEQTDPKAKDGSGGNLEESYPTAWYMWPTGTGPVGRAAGPPLPYEVSCAVTLQTDHRGPSGRGRFYAPPFYSGAMQAGGIFATGAAESFATGFGDYVDGVKTNTPYLPIVVSSRRLILNEVTSINVGHVPDSQRRRRRNQDEARVTVWP